MSHRIVCAVALVAYAVVVLLGAASGHMLPVTFSIFDIPRALVAVLLALGVFLRSRLADLIAVAYIVWFGRAFRRRARVRGGSHCCGGRTQRKRTRATSGRWSDVVTWRICALSTSMSFVTKM